MSEPASSLADVTQMAAGVIAAKHRGDPAGAQELLAALGADATQGFLVLSEIALTLVRSKTGQSMDELVQELSLIVGATLGDAA